MQFFDLTVPGGVGGKATIEEIRRLDTDVTVFIASEYADDPVITNHDEYNYTENVFKPFRSVELSDLLNK